MTVLHGGGLKNAFDRASGAYDSLTSVNPGYHRHLRLAARGMLSGAQRAGGGAGMRVLDLGCGTGASTAAVLRAAPKARIVAADASAGMLERARAKEWNGNVTFVQAPAEALEDAGVHGPFDAVFAAYLVRNLSEPDTVLQRVRGLLRPGGRLAVHEYTLSGAVVHRAVWSAVCGGVIVPLGSLGPGGSRLYRHLWRSVLLFDTAGAFSRRLSAAGYEAVCCRAVRGWQRGIVHTFYAQRPGGERES
ncbi:class I SAM-dependent methyltransferase [Streptomyces ovatisporus]|uniref:Class I SAM-dependent methyltransferase n=1 Tax=Streptomyces ovatisporus TaxID=1128682 RepID=A0ABV9AEU5_9ACTN